MTTAFFGSLTTSLLKSYSALLLHSHSFISVLIENRRVRQCKYINRWTYQCRGLKPNKYFTKSFVCVWGWMALCVYVIIPSSDSLVRLTEEIPSITDAHHCTQTLIKKHSCTYIYPTTHTHSKHKLIQRSWTLNPTFTFIQHIYASSPSSCYAKI